MTTSIQEYVLYKDRMKQSKRKTVMEGYTIWIMACVGPPSMTWTRKTSFYESLTPWIACSMFIHCDSNCTITPRPHVLLTNESCECQRSGIHWSLKKAHLWQLCRTFSDRGRIRARTEEGMKRWWPYLGSCEWRPSALHLLRIWERWLRFSHFPYRCSQWPDINFECIIARTSSKTCEKNVTLWNYSLPSHLWSLPENYASRIRPHRGFNR